MEATDAKAGAQVCRIAIVGPESTGKSTLAEQLAAHYHTLWVPEYARTYLESINRPYTQEDVEHIARQQIEAEDKLAQEAGKCLFCDTNLIVIKIWMENAYGRCPKWVEDEIKQRKYELHLLADIDLPWERDPLREHPDQRDYFFERYQTVLRKLNIPYRIVNGFGESRLKLALRYLEEINC